MNVLICDDDASTRFVLRRILSHNLGWTVAESSDGADALRQLADRPFDLLLLDLEMPAFSGFEVLEALRSSDSMKDLPVVVVSQERRRDVIMRLRDQHIASYLLKPLRADHVVDHLANLHLTTRGRARSRADISGLHVSPQSPGMLVEGDPDYRDFFSLEAERHGPIRVADSAASALTSFRTSPVDVVFVGSKLGVMGAGMLVRKIRETSPGTPVRIVAIVDSEAAKRDAASSGFDEAMVRSFVPAVFASEFKRFTAPSGPIAVLSQLLPDFRDGTVNSVRQVFGMMLGSDVEVLPEPADVQVAAQSTVNMDIDERVRVAVTVHLSSALVDEVNAVLGGADVANANREATTGELVKLVAGRLHARAGERSVRSVCSQPGTVWNDPAAPLAAIPDGAGYLFSFRTKGVNTTFAISLRVGPIEEETVTP